MIPLLMFAAMGAVAADSRPASDPWARDDLGQTAIFQMAGAPYPHKSRDEGFKIEGKFFPPRAALHG